MVVYDIKKDTLTKRCRSRDDTIGNIDGKDICSRGTVRSARCLSVQWWHEMQIKACISIGCSKMNHQAFMNTQRSSEVLQSIHKIKFVTISSNLYKMFFYIVIKRYIR